VKIDVIDNIINGLRMGRRPDHQKEIQKLLTASHGENKEVHVIADLFIGDFKLGRSFLRSKVHFRI
jgi:hypothetical protein